MSRTRTVALLLLAAGCGQPTSTAPTAAKPAPAVASVAPVAAAKPAPAAKPETTLAAADVLAANAAARALIDGVMSGKPDPAKVAPGFRKLLAGGDDAKADWAAEQYLKGLAGGLSAGSLTTNGAGPAVVGFTAPAGDGRRAAVRVAKAADGWQVDWLHVGPAGPTPALTGPDLAQRFAAAAFVEAALTNQPRLAEAALDPAARGRIAPPLGNDPLGFSRGILSNALKSFAGGATGYTLTLTTGPQVAGELLGPGDQRRPFTLTLTETPDGWRVGDFSPR